MLKQKLEDSERANDILNNRLGKQDDMLDEMVQQSQRNRKRSEHFHQHENKFEDMKKYLEDEINKLQNKCDRLAAENDKLKKLVKF